MNNITKLFELPINFARTFDFLPLLSYKQTLEAEQTVGFLSGEASLNLTIPLREDIQNKDHDITINRIVGSSQKHRVKYNPSDYTNTKKLSTIYDETMELTGAAVPEVVIKGIFPIIENHTIDGADNLGFFQRGISNRVRSTQRRFGLRGIANPYRIIKSLATQRAIWTKEASKTIRSHLRLTNLVGINDNGKHVGWQELFDTPEYMLEDDSGISFPTALSQACREYIKDKWWMDYGIPRRFLTLTDGVTIDGILYLLAREQRTIVS